VRTFVDKLDFITSVGYLRGPGDRERCGLTGAGPSLVITDLGLLRPQPETLVLELTHLHPGASLGQARAATGWDLAVPADLATTEPPTTEELEVLRRLNAKQAGSPHARGSS
jgi:glutaconate CoA-transferase subunit B